MYVFIIQNLVLALLKCYLLLVVRVFKNRFCVCIRFAEAKNYTDFFNNSITFIAPSKNAKI